MWAVFKKTVCLMKIEVQQDRDRALKQIPVAVLGGCLEMLLAWPNTEVLEQRVTSEEDV